MTTHLVSVQIVNHVKAGRFNAEDTTSCCGAVVRDLLLRSKDHITCHPDLASCPRVKE